MYRFSHNVTPARDFSVLAHGVLHRDPATRPASKTVREIEADYPLTGSITSLMFVRSSATFGSRIKAPSLSVEYLKEKEPLSRSWKSFFDLLHGPERVVIAIRAAFDDDLLADLPELPEIVMRAVFAGNIGISAVSVDDAFDRQLQSVPIAKKDRICQFMAERAVTRLALIHESRARSRVSIPNMNITRDLMLFKYH